MSAAGVWAGLADSVFLAGFDPRERDPAHIAVAFVGGCLLAMLAAICCHLLIVIPYALLAGEGARGLNGLGDVARAMNDPNISSPALTVVRLIVATADNAVLWVVLVAFAAVIVHHPLRTYLTVAPHFRWRLMGLAMVLAIAVVMPMVIAERVLEGDAALPPILSVSSLPGDRLGYILAALLLIPAAFAEELIFRGWLMRQIGAFLRKPAIVISVSSLTFSAVHGDFAPDVFLARALMGAGFGYMTLRLGGIEFPTGVHAAYNILLVLFLQPLSVGPTVGADVPAFSVVANVALLGGYVLITELTVRIPALRRLAGLRMEEISPSHDVSAHVS